MFYLAQFTENINSNINISSMVTSCIPIFSQKKTFWFKYQQLLKIRANLRKISHSQENINPDDKLTRASTHSSCRVCSPWQPASVCLLRSPILLKDLWQPGQEYFLF